MKQCLALILLLSSIAGMARERSQHIRINTQQYSNIIAEAQIDQVGAKLINRKTKDSLRASCEERDEKNDCLKMFFVLETGGKNYIVHDQPENKINIDLTTLETKAELKQYKVNVKQMYNDYTKRDENMLDHHFYLSLRTMVQGELKSPLNYLLLPLAIPTDFAMTSLHIYYDIFHFFKEKKIEKMNMKLLLAPNDDRKVSNAVFEKVLYSLSSNL